MTGRGCHVEHWAGQARQALENIGIIMGNYFQERGNSISINAVCVTGYIIVDLFELMCPIMSDRNLMFTITICKYNMIVPIAYNMFGFIQYRVNFF